MCVPPRLTFKNSSFCPQNSFVCFVWFSEQMAIIFIHRITWLVSVTGRESLLGGTTNFKIKCKFFLVFVGFIYTIFSSVQLQRKNEYVI